MARGDKNPAGMGRNLHMKFDDVSEDPKQPVHYVYVNENVSVFEATHRRNTIWLRDAIDKKLNALCERRGDKTRIVNDALAKFFADMNNPN